MYPYLFILISLALATISLYLLALGLTKFEALYMITVFEARALEGARMEGAACALAACPRRVVARARGVAGHPRAEKERKSSDARKAITKHRLRARRGTCEVAGEWSVSSE